SGAGSDGARGLQAIRAGGGITIVQDPKEAKFGTLPKAAIAADGIDFKVSLDDIGPTILAIVERRRDASPRDASAPQSRLASQKSTPRPGGAAGPVPSRRSAAPLHADQSGPRR